MIRHAMLIAAVALAACGGGNQDNAGDTAGGAVLSPATSDSAALGAGGAAGAGGTGGTSGAAGAAGTTGTGTGTATGDTGAARNQTQSGVTNARTGQSTLGPGVTRTAPTGGTGTTARDTTRPPR
jgi:hypothetical protein